MRAPRAKFISIEHERAQKLRETAESIRNREQPGTMHHATLADDAEGNARRIAAGNARRIAAGFSGSGFTELAIDVWRTTPESLVLKGEYHVMDGESGMYIGYIGFTAIVTAAPISGYTSYDLEIERAPNWTDEIEDEHALQDFVGDTLYSFLVDEEMEKEEAFKG